jgi:predicted RNA-binding protein (virulence factor B family)
MLTKERLRELQLSVEVKDLRQAAKAYYGEDFEKLHTTVVDNLKSEAGIALVKEALESGSILVTRKHGPDGGPVQFLQTLPEHLPQQWRDLA